MVSCNWRRRSVLAALACAPFAPRLGFAEGVTNLTWRDLLPKDAPFVPNLLQEFIDHDGPPMTNAQPASSGVRTDWNGQTVRLPGFIVPLDHQGTGVVAFILVPFVGACVHVPPPPANQLVFVTTQTPYESSGLFESVHVTGRFTVTHMTTQLADIGYAMTADQIAPFSA